MADGLVDVVAVDTDESAAAPRLARHPGLSDADAYDSHDELIDSFRSSTLPLPRTKSAYAPGTNQLRKRTDEDDIDDVRYG